MTAVDTPVPSEGEALGTGPTILAVVLRAGDRVRAGHRFDVTSDMPSGVWKAWRTLCGQRRDGEHVLVTVTADGMPYGSWNADKTWPRASADAIARARTDAQEALPA